MFPESYLERMRAMLGAEFDDYLASCELSAVKGLRVNTLKARPDWLPPYTLSPVPWAADGYYYPEEERPGKDALHEAGLYYIQEPSAMSAAELLSPAPHTRVLDLCAAPGGKTTHAACLMRDTGLLVANEIVSSRARILAENVRRMGLTHTVVTNMHPVELAKRWEGYFDAVIVDAPCSGEGMFRKNGDAGREWSAESVRACAERQSLILDSAARLVRGGGRIVYSTCTFSREENEDNAAAFLDRHSDFALLPARAEGLRRGFDPQGYTARVFPHLVRGEGHFAALFERTGGGVCRVRPESPRADRKAVQVWRKWADEVGIDADGDLMQWGETLYRVPELPALDGIKTLLAGLELGQVRKDRFEPSHALALSALADTAPHIDLGGERVDAYLRGESFAADGTGWTVVRIEGYSLGWVKISSGTAKNHYPKSLRRS